MDLSQISMPAMELIFLNAVASKQDSRWAPRKKRCNPTMNKKMALFYLDTSILGDYMPFPCAPHPSAYHPNQSV